MAKKYQRQKAGGCPMSASKSSVLNVTFLSLLLKKANA
jgi:hypothetical protein